MNATVVCARARVRTAVPPSTHTHTQHKAMDRVHVATDAHGRSTEHIARCVALAEAGTWEKEAVGTSYDTGVAGRLQEIISDLAHIDERTHFLRVGSLETHKSGGYHVGRLCDVKVVDRIVYILMHWYTYGPDERTWERREALQADLGDAVFTPLFKDLNRRLRERGKRVKLNKDSAAFAHHLTEHNRQQVFLARQLKLTICEFVRRHVTKPHPAGLSSPQHHTRRLDLGMQVTFEQHRKCAFPGMTHVTRKSQGSMDADQNQFMKAKTVSYLPTLAAVKQFFGNDRDLCAVNGFDKTVPPHHPARAPAARTLPWPPQHTLPPAHMRGHTLFFFFLPRARTCPNPRRQDRAAPAPRAHPALRAGRQDGAAPAHGAPPALCAWPCLPALTVSCARACVRSIPIANP